MHANLPIAVHVFFKKDSQIFLMQRANTGFKDGEWSVPAGRLDVGESIKQAAVREVMEEAGALINIDDLERPLVMHHKDERGERLYFFFICDKWENELQNMEADKCGATCWFDINNLPESMVDHVKNAFIKIQKDVHYVEYGF